VTLKIHLKIRKMVLEGNCGADFPACRQAGELLHFALTQEYLG